MFTWLVSLFVLVSDPPTDVHIEPLDENVWLHTSYMNFDNGARVLSNGLIVRSDDGITLVDTAWTDDQTAYILDWVETHLDGPVDTAILTHAHQDKMGGTGLLHQRNVQTHALDLSNQLAPMRGLQPARHDIRLEPGQSRLLAGLEVFYPGAGHATDNIVVYLPDTAILHGGCFIRPGDARTLGNTADGDVNEWDHAVGRTIDAFPHAVRIIPSHGAPGDRALLDHTIRLVQSSGDDR